MQPPHHHPIQVVTLSLAFALLALAILLTQAQAEPATVLRTLHSGHQFLPPYPNPRDRFGFDSGTLTGYDVAQLRAGWYSNWTTSITPAHPDGLTYVQLIRFHAGADPHDPTQVTVNPSRTVIAQIAAAHPGSLWLMSNEPDSIYQGDPIHPEVYAIVYHDLYTYIKGVDASAQIANGGIVQPTPCRIEYLDIVWDTYQQTYGERMPVDVWNIHAFILREVINSWGASTPPGVDPSCGIDYDIRDGDNIDIFRQNLIAFRQWMKNKGEQDKPLIISEYGVLWPDWLADEDGGTFTPARVSHFMTQTFDLFLNEAHPDVGYPADDYRLVQAWAWYSLSDDQQYNGYLFHSGSKQLSPMGQAYAAYTAALADVPYTDLTTQLWIDQDPLDHLSASTPYDVLTVTLPATGSVANLGRVPAAGVVITVPSLGFQATRDVPARYTGDADPLPLPSVVITQPGTYDLSLVADPTHATVDPRRWNNTYTVTVDARPDLVISMTAWSIQPSGASSGWLHAILTTTNSGGWPSPPVSSTLRLSNVLGTLLLPEQRSSIPALGTGTDTTCVETLTWSTSGEDFYRLALEVDSEGVANERHEDNNWLEVTIHTTVTATLQPGVSSVLTSASGHLAFLFPAGTVTTPTEIHFTPLLASERSPAHVLGLAAFRLTAYQAGQPPSLQPMLPIPLTWRYTDPDLAGADEEHLGLYHATEDGSWQRVFCPAEQRQPATNRLDTCIQHLGDYVFGQGYVSLLPLAMAGSGTSGPDVQEIPPHVQPGLPLRLRPRTSLSTWH